jgi:hypothetical protein
MKILNFISLFVTSILLTNPIIAQQSNALRPKSLSNQYLSLGCGTNNMEGLSGNLRFIIEFSKWKGVSLNFSLNSKKNSGNPFGYSGKFKNFENGDIMIRKISLNYRIHTKTLNSKLKFGLDLGPSYYQTAYPTFCHPSNCNPPLISISSNDVTYNYLQNNLGMNGKVFIQFLPKRSYGLELNLEVNFLRRNSFIAFSLELIIGKVRNKTFKPPEIVN